MAETVGQHSVAAFTSPVNGTSPIDANTVKGNDNTIRSAYVDHDADPGIHVQSSTLASRPVANSAGRKWMTQDSGVIRLFYDDGTSWYEVDYLRTTGGTISGNLAITGTLAVTGVATFTAQPILSSLTASRAVFTDGSKGLVSNAITGTGDVVMSASPTLTGTITAASATLSGTLGVSGLLTFASLKGTGATTVTNILDEDNMASDSATALATQQSIKAYVDAQVGASDALSEVLAIGNTTGANDIIVSVGQKIRTPLIASQNNATAITIADTTGALTFASALADSNLATISTAGKVSNSATTATSANTASAIVARDASGNFTAGTITAALTGNASTATTLQTARNINGVSFNGSADITVTAAAGTLTGTTLASNVTASSLTSVGTLANLTVTNPISGSVTGSAGSVAASALTGTTLASGVTASSLTSVGTLSSLTVSGDLTVDTDTLKVDSTNNRVGIGTATPSYRTDISNVGGSAAALRVLGNDQSNVRLRIENSGSGGRAFELTGGLTGANNSDFTLYDATAAATRLSVDASGNLAVDTNTLYVDAANNRVGVGTASPAYPLHVERSSYGMTGYFFANDGTSNPRLAIYGNSSGTTIQHTFSTGADALMFAVGGAVGSGTERMRLDASGNLGIGVTPSSWGSGGKAIQIGTGTGVSGIGSDTHLSNGMYYDGTNWKYLSSGVGVGTYYQTGGTHNWYSAGSGTAGNNVSLGNPKMTLDASGRLGIGTASPGTLLSVSQNGATNNQYIQLVDTQASGVTWQIANYATNTLGMFGLYNATAGAYRLLLSGDGNLGLGVTPTEAFCVKRGAGTAAYGEFAGNNNTPGSTSALYGQDAGGNAYAWNRANLPLIFGTNNTERARIDASGNLGIGVTPNAWSTNIFRTLQVGTGAGSVSFSGRTDGGSDMVLGKNLYNVGGTFYYVANGVATMYRMDGGVHSWNTAPSGTAGNAITFTQAMTLDASGNLGVGTTSPTMNGGGTSKVMHIHAAGTNEWAISHYTTGSTGAAAGDGMVVGIIGTDATIGCYEAYPLVFATNGGTERARITSGGYFKASDTGTYDSGSTSSFHEVYQSANARALNIRQANASFTGDALIVVADRNTTNNTFYAISYYNATGGLYKFRVADSGDVTNTNGSYTAISDEKLKQDIIDAPSQWDDIKATRFRKYRFKADVERLGDDAPYLLGVVAQELELTSPGCIDEHPDYEEQEVTDEDGNVTTERVKVGSTKSFKQSVYLMKAAVALQEAMARIESLEARLAALES